MPDTQDMTPREISEKLKPYEYVKLCSEIEKEYKQAFGVIDINRSTKGTSVVVELKDNTRHTVII